MRYAGVLALVLIACACGDPDPVQSAQTEDGARARLAVMRQEVDALVGDACGAMDCRYVGMGAKPCGGPWEYIIYSTAATDSAALAERLGQYKAFEADMNQRYGYSSDCSVPNEPVLGCEAGRCVDLVQGGGAQGGSNLLQGSGTVSMSPDQAVDPAPAEAILPRFAMDMDVASDAFDVQEARIEGDILAVVVGYGGGCEAHQFALLASLAATRSIPPQHRLKLLHQGNGDVCEAYLTSALRFDLTPFRGLYPELAGVAFHLEGVQDVLDYVF